MLISLLVSKTILQGLRILHSGGSSAAMCYTIGVGVHLMRPSALLRFRLYIWVLILSLDVFDNWLKK